MINPQAIRRHVSDNLPLYVLGVVVAALIAAIAVLIPMAIEHDNAWKANCVEQGGRVLEDSTVATGIDASTGKTTTTYSSKTYCLNSQGGIIDIL